MASKALEAYLALERAREILAETLAEFSCAGWKPEEIESDIVSAMDRVWQYALSDEDRAWLDGRKDDGEART